MKSDAIIGAIQDVTKKWAKQRKREEREASAKANRRWVLTRSSHVTIKEAAWEIMEEAYLKASAGGRLPAHARQVMYAARGHIQRTADRELGKNFDQYFTQTLLPDYMEARPSKTADWNVVFDARGHFHEPHTNEQVPLGTLQVRSYLKQVEEHEVQKPEFNVWEEYFPTSGPQHRYGAILFIEKEGFMPLFEEVRLAERYDLAIMSTKGMSVTASRQLVDRLCAKPDVPLLVLHDFDKAGFSIVGTLQRSTRRYAFENDINVVDLILRMEDVGGLETESVYVQSPRAARQNLRQNGATEEEIGFLLHSRVELNAFASDYLIAWIEKRLDEHGVSKVVPNVDHLAEAYRRMVEQAFVQRQINEVTEEARELGESADVPEDLRHQVERRLREDPSVSWDQAVKEIAVLHIDEEDA